jgi:hypothetical protein
MVYTGSKNVLRMDRARLSAFIGQLCQKGIELDWFLSGSAGVSSSAELRADAQALCNHPHFRVLEPVGKTELASRLATYDCGLFWAPMADQHTLPELGRSYFLSAASNKIGEYIAAGLVVAHTGNPGLAYLPEAVCADFDPTDPVAGADQLTAALADRDQVELKRAAALRYHLDEMNFEAQAAPLMRYIMDGHDALFVHGSVQRDSIRFRP